MKTNETIMELLKRHVFVIIGIAGGVTSALTTYNAYGPWSVTAGAIVFAFFCLWDLFRIRRSSAELTYFSNSKNLRSALVEHLEKTNKSLYYVGGAGFISENTEWRNNYIEKLADTGIEVVRLIDLKSPAEFEQLLSEAQLNDVQKGECEQEVNDYRTWKRTHALYLTDKSTRSRFYNFEGAPLWRYGINLIIFDSKHVAIIPPPVDKERSGIILESPVLAAELIRSIESLIPKFGLESLTSDEIRQGA